MGGRKRDYITLNHITKQCIDDCVKEEVGRRFMTVLGEIDNESTTAFQDTALSLKYYATAKCMMLRAVDEMQELTSYMAAIDSLPEERRNLKKMSKLYEAKQKRYDYLEAEVYKLQTWLSDIDFAVSKLENDNQRKWIVGRYMLEKTDAEIVEGKPGISGRNRTRYGDSAPIERAIDTLKYYMFPLKALREDVLNLKNRNKMEKQ